MQPGASDFTFPGQSLGTVSVCAVNLLVATVASRFLGNVIRVSTYALLVWQSKTGTFVANHSRPLVLPSRRNLHFGLPKLQALSQRVPCSQRKH